jgi:hypothetical protein
MALKHCEQYMENSNYPYDLLELWQRKFLYWKRILEEKQKVIIYYFYLN